MAKKRTQAQIAAEAAYRERQREIKQRSIGPFTDETLALLDSLRGDMSRVEYIKRVLVKMDDRRFLGCRDF